MQKSIIGIIAIVVVVIAVAGVFVAMQPAATTTTAPELVKFGVIYETPVSQSWSGSQHRAFQELYDEGKIDYTYVESVMVNDGERVGEELINTMNCDVVVYTSWYADPIKALTEKYPDIMFVGGGGGVWFTDIWGEGPYPSNYAHYDFVSYQASYVVGAIAGRLSQTGKMGMVGAYPIPDYNAPMNGVIEGFVSVIPDAEVVVSWLNTWEDPAQAKQAAEAMIDSGADVIFGGLYGVEKAVDEHPGTYSIGYYANTNSAAPDGAVGSIVWYPKWVYLEIADIVKSGTLERGEYSCTLIEGGTLPELNERVVSSALMAEADDLVQQIKDGTLTPVYDINLPEEVWASHIVQQ